MSKYTPSEREMAVAWSEYRDLMDACNALVRDEDDDPRAEFDAFLARVRRDAAREALDGLAKRFEAMGDGADQADAWAWEWHAQEEVEEYRDHHYPKQEDDR